MLKNFNSSKMKNKFKYNQNFYSETSNCDSELYSSFTNPNSIYDSACSEDRSEDSIASSQTYSTFCSNTASTSTSSTLVVESTGTPWKVLSVDESLTLTKDSSFYSSLMWPKANLNKKLQNKPFINCRDKYISNLLPDQGEKFQQLTDTTRIQNMNTNRSDMTSNTKNEWTARSNSTFRASSRPDLSQKFKFFIIFLKIYFKSFLINKIFRSMDLDFSNGWAAYQNINKSNLFPAHSNPSIFFNSMCRNKKELFQISTCDKIDTSLKLMQESPRSSFRQHQSFSDQLFKTNGFSKHISPENVYENLQFIKKSNHDSDAYKFYKHQNLTNKVNPKQFVSYNKSTIRDAKYRSHSAASYKVKVKEVTPLETSM